MMQVNLIVEINPQRLNRPLHTMYAHSASSFAVAVSGIPEDCAAPVLRLYYPASGDSVDHPISQGPECAIVRIPPSAFPSGAAPSHYAIYATDAAGNSTFLGSGLVYMED